MSGNEQRICFNASVTGVSHAGYDLPCQDASGSFRSEDGSYTGVVVADGHGASACMRSDRGSKIAVAETIRCLKAFAEFYPDHESIEKNNPGKYGYDLAIRQLTDAIISSWSEQVLEDYQKDPLTDEEKLRAGKYDRQYAMGMHLERIYGTTLIAALKTEDYLLLLQQGDGMCELVYADESIRRPIPVDERCYANVTTSLSDEDATRGIRSKLMIGGKKELVACFLSTDGFENGMFDEDERRGFYRDALEGFSGDEEKACDIWLEDKLKSVSSKGNGDDISLAGMEISGIRR